MPTGLQIFSATGELQIDSDTRNYALKASGTITLTGNATPSVLKTATVTVNSAFTPLVAIRPRTVGHRVCHWFTSVSGSTWTFTFIGTNGAVVDFYVYDKWDTPSANLVGLEVYRYDGVVTFSTSLLSMRIVGLGTNVTGLSASRTYAGIMMGLGLQEDYQPELEFGGTYPYTSRIYGVSRTSTSMASSLTIFENYPVSGPPGPEFTDPQPGVIVCDVTGL
jgi:hypothetical protein